MYILSSSIASSSPCLLLLQSELHQSRLQELDAITSDRDAARKEYEDLRKRRLDEFMAGFSVITSKLKEMYQVKPIYTV